MTAGGSGATQLSPHWRNILNVFQALLATLRQNFVPPFLVSAQMRPLAFCLCPPISPSPTSASSSTLAVALPCLWVTAQPVLCSSSGCRDAGHAMPSPQPKA